MLVLSRKYGESIQIADNITITVLSVRGSIVRLGIEAPKEINVARAELTREPTRSELVQNGKAANNGGHQSGTVTQETCDASHTGLLQPCVRAPQAP